MTSGDTEQRFGPSMGRFTGFLGLGVCATVIATVAAGDLTAGSVRAAAVAAGGAVVLWTYLLRPRIVLEAGGATLALHNPLSTWRLPLQSVRSVWVKAVTSVQTDDDTRYDAVAVGYPLRKLARAARPSPASGGFPDTVASRVPRHDEQSVMVEAIRGAADRARVLGIVGPPAERTPAIVELAAFALTVLVFAATYLV